MELSDQHLDFTFLEDNTPKIFKASNKWNHTLPTSLSWRESHKRNNSSVLSWVTLLQRQDCSIPVNGLCAVTPYVCTSTLIAIDASELNSVFFWKWRMSCTYIVSEIIDAYEKLSIIS